MSLKEHERINEEMNAQPQSSPSLRWGNSVNRAIQNFVLKFHISLFLTLHLIQFPPQPKPSFSKYQLQLPALLYFPVFSILTSLFWHRFCERICLGRGMFPSSDLSFLSLPLIRSPWTCTVTIYTTTWTNLDPELSSMTGKGCANGSLPVSSGTL